MDLLKSPDRNAIVMGSGLAVTYAELETGSVRFARVLHERGLRRGDHVALYAENHIRFFEVFWALMRSGLYLTPINWHLGPEEAGYIVDDCEAKCLVTTKARAADAASIRALAPNCGLEFMIDGVEPGFESYEDAVARQPAERMGEEPRGDFMLYSSGTTGRPKGIERPPADLAFSDATPFGASLLEQFLLGMGESSVYLCPAPLYHAAPLAFTSGIHDLGGTAVIMESFDPEQMLRLIERERVTDVQCVPTHFVRLLKLDEATRNRYDLSSLKTVVHAAAPCPPDVKQRMIEWLGPIVHEYYSSTEGAGFTFIEAKDWLTHPGSVGRSVTGPIHICDENGTELPVGEPGHLYFELGELAFRYKGDDDKTRGLLHPQHPTWVGIGDMGYVDDEGYLYLTDRKSFMIISGGVNIYPAEIEGVLLEYPSVHDAAVFGLPDSEMGEFVHAVVELDPGVEGDPELADDIRSFVRSRLAGFKVPRRVDFVDHLPRQANGKLYKKALREEYLSREEDDESQTGGSRSCVAET